MKKPTRSDIEIEMLADVLKQTGFTWKWFEVCCALAVSGNKHATFLVEYVRYLIDKERFGDWIPEPQWRDYGLD